MLIRVGLKLDESENGHRDPQGRRSVRMEAETGVMQPQPRKAKDGWPPPEAVSSGRGKKGPLLEPWEEAGVMPP